ncbi:lytic transglycosylase domain-containing protein [Pontibacter sp. JAM-7]|uniref:lytic transglycosylase domain-containing protein n=1 Tax=Pontibacter sp. JAM-7 TaxID=3366581 RepID=UPI003AF8D271
MLSTTSTSVLAAAAIQEQPDPDILAALKTRFATADSFADRFAAEVWLTDISGRIQRYVKDDLKRIELLKKIHAEANQQALPVDLVLGVIHTESLFDRFAISSVGAQGLMQVMPFWKNEIGRPDDNLMNIETNLSYGCTILNHYLKRARGNLTEALARYNGSYGKTWYPEKVYRNQRRYSN